MTPEHVSEFSDAGESTAILASFFDQFGPPFGGCSHQQANTAQGELSANGAIVREALFPDLRSHRAHELVYVAACELLGSDLDDHGGFRDPTTPRFFQPGRASMAA
jgi:hypothetical protein